MKRIDTIGSSPLRMVGGDNKESTCKAQMINVQKTSMIFHVRFLLFFLASLKSPSNLVI